MRENTYNTFFLYMILLHWDEKEQEQAQTFI